MLGSEHKYPCKELLRDHIPQVMHRDNWQQRTDSKRQMMDKRQTRNERQEKNKMPAANDAGQVTRYERRE